MLHVLHQCYMFCTGVTLFAPVLHLNCTVLSQSESRNISWARRTLPSFTQFPYSVSNCTSSVRNIRISHMMGPCNKFLIKATSVEVSLRSRELKLNLRCEQSRLRTWDTGPQPRDKNYNATQMVSKRGH